MSDLFNDLFDFDASSMATFEVAASNKVEMFDPKPEGQKSYIVTFRLLQNVLAPKQSIVHKIYYWLTDGTGSFGYDSPNLFKQFCPATTAYWALFNNPNEVIKKLSEKLRIQKQYVSYIQIVNDAYDTSNNGKILPYRIPVPVYKKIATWLNPSADDLKAGKTAKELYNPFSAFNLVLTVTNKMVGTQTMRNYEVELSDEKAPIFLDGVALTDTPDNRVKYGNVLKDAQTVDLVERFGYKEADDATKARVKALMGGEFGQLTNYWPEISAVASAPAVDGVPSIATPTQVAQPVAATVVTDATAIPASEVVADVEQPFQAIGNENISSIVDAINNGGTL